MCITYRNWLLYNYFIVVFRIIVTVMNLQSSINSTVLTKSGLTMSEDGKTQRHP